MRLFPLKIAKVAKNHGRPPKLRPQLVLQLRDFLGGRQVANIYTGIGNKLSGVHRHLSINYWSHILTSWPRLYKISLLGSTKWKWTYSLGESTSLPYCCLYWEWEYAVSSSGSFRQTGSKPSCFVMHEGKGVSLHCKLLHEWRELHTADGFSICIHLHTVVTCAPGDKEVTLLEFVLSKV